MRDCQRGKPLPAGRWTSVSAPALVVDGGKSPAWMRNGTKALAAALPHATYRTLAGQTHSVKAKVRPGAGRFRGRAAVILTAPI